MNKQKVQRWVSKYWKTAGVQLRSGEVSDNYFWMDNNDLGWRTLVGKKQFHDTREDAVRAAEASRDKTIANLKKRIAKLEKMTF